MRLEYMSIIQLIIKMPFMSIKFLIQEFCYEQILIIENEVMIKVKGRWYASILAERCLP